ncbi:hypothetical protein PPSIR1_10580 [Plesiocystis pacifica SIR-1]|uniref:Uncharacterized protein n=1 Tax=Plesiocystis pacifica SIR-1 TaxID=391625 RepID=A6G4V0_9BACT|nr:hypothetical protein [Plesiocystis pacifica]EDM79042.1 hypothetical protein PPSIR1_10580 [Plesiocystis pacifica SIR-1]
MSRARPAPTAPSSPPREPRLGLARLGAQVGLGALVGLGAGCIVPDTFIDVRVGGQNEHGVRIVESIPLDEAAAEACNADLECPMPRETGLPVYLDPREPEYQFCICGENQIDDNRLNPVTLYAEDADQDEGMARDSLYAALLLDWSPTTGDSAFDYVAYRSYLDPRSPVPLFFSPYETQVIRRPTPFQRAIQLSDVDGSSFDLCNGSGTELTPGVHTLTLLVTDRDWFQTEPTIVTGDTGDESGGFETLAIKLEGVPDIAAGATYDLETYVFSCLEVGEEGCNCVDVEENP